MKITKLLVITFVVAFALVATVSVQAQTATTTTGTDTSVTAQPTAETPGLPNTGVGGQAATNIAILLSSGLVTLAGIAFLARKGIQARSS